MSKEKEEEKKSFWSNPTVVKAKGVVKLAFGALVLLQPSSAFLIAASLCTAGIAAMSYNKMKGRPWSQMWTDIKDGTFLKEVKDTFGMGAGAGIGLLSPYAGIALATFGALSYLSGHGSGVEGLFKGGALATAVGTVALPVVGAAFVAEGLMNGLGYDYPLIGKSFELTKGMLKSVARVMGIAEKNPDSPVVALNAAVKETAQGIEATKDARGKIGADLSKQATNIQKTVDSSEMPDAGKSWVSKVASALHLTKGATQVEKVENGRSSPSVTQGKQ